MNKNLRNVLKAFMLLVCFSFFQNETNAQTFDNGIFFQALARDNYSNPAKDRKIYVQSTIIQSTINGTKVLVEEYQTTTDATGVFGISIGKGTRTGGSLSALNNIDWSAGPYFLNLKISITPVAPLESWNYSKDWVDLGTTSFGTVPYALYAKSVAGFDTKVNVSDTAKMLLPYAKAQALTLIQNAVNTKLNTADSVVAYVTPTQLTKTKVDTTSLSNRINLKADASDVLANTASITANTNSISTITTSVAANTASITALSTVASSGNYNDLINKPTLPTASVNTLGAVKVGANLTIDQNGVLSITSGSGVPYTGATGAVNLGAYDLAVNGLTIGTGAGTSTSTSLYNTAVGFNALVTNTTGTNNSAFGRGALRYNTTGNYNTALGLQSLNTNTTGLENTASGALSLFYNTTGNFNTAFGTRALFANTTGTDNAAFGQLSSYLNQTGSYNTTIGTRSMFNNVYGNANTAVGWNSSTFTGVGGTSSSSGGNNNTSLGYRALYSNTLGNDNTAVGYNALQANLTGTQNTTIGSGADVSSNALSNATAIGYGAIVTTSNTMQLGNANVTLVKTSGTLITPKIGVGTSTPVSAAAVEINSTTQGFLPPRMRAGQRDSIAAPVQGLVVYCTNCGSSGELEVYNGSTWVNLVGSAAQSVPSTGQYAYSFTQTLVGGSYVYSTYKFDGTAWTYVAASPISNSIGNYVGQIGSNHYSLIYNGSSYSMYVFNGTTWSLVSTSGTAPSSVYAGYMGVFNNKLYHYLYNGTGYSTYSFDGTTWQTVTTAGTPPTNGLYGGYLGSFSNISYFYAYNGTSYSLYSFNGTTWTTISNSSTNSYTFLGQIGNTSYLSYYNGSGYSYSTFNGTSFASWNPSGLPSGISGYNFNYMGVINNKLYTAITDNSTGTRTMYSFDGTSFTNLSSITNPGSYYGGFNCYMCSTYFIGGNLK
jgi:hypothetical protein